MGMTVAYPTWVTLHAGRVGDRFSPAYGWRQTAWRVSQDLQLYGNFFGIFVPEWTHMVIVAPKPAVVLEVYPLAFLLAAVVALIVFPIFAALALPLIAVELLPILLRAYYIHFSAAALWQRSGATWAVAWFAYLLLLPVVAALTLPATVFYALVVAGRSGRALYAARGNPLPAALCAGAEFLSFELMTRRYILGIDVPFVEGGAPSGGSVPWMIAGVGPALLALVLLPLPMILLAVISIVPVVVRSFELLEQRAHNGATTSSAYIPIYFTIVLLPVIVPVALVLLALGAVADAVRVAPLIMFQKRSWAAGFSVLPGMLYKCVRRRGGSGGAAAARACSFHPILPPPARAPYSLPPRQIRVPHPRLCLPQARGRDDALGVDPALLQGVLAAAAARQRV